MLRKGDSVGRYVVVGKLGAGGMGVVYKAEDPELGRLVALKLVRVDRTPTSPASDHTTEPDESRARLVREAQAMARLAHPNVITVHDVGTHGDEVFVAMEFVDGLTLTRWLDERRSWRDILGAFVQAGRGLAAAHRAGLVHRDFKPDNVLVGGDGRVRVLDFGLSRALDDAGPDTPGSRSPALHDSLTMTGATVGTPAYMSPEQHMGRNADDRSDQFSFCVALWRALAGDPPFSVGGNVEDLARSVVTGKLREPPAGRMPRFVRRALGRGLSPRPEQRFPSMDALLDALGRDPRRRVLVGLAASGAAALIAVALVAARRPGEPLCRGAERHLAGVWDPARREEIRAAFAATGADFAADTYRAAAEELDGWTAGWLAEHQSTCEATHVRGEQSAELLDLRMDCLAGRREQLTAVVDLLARADKAVVERAVNAAQALPSLDECRDVRQLVERVRPPNDPRAREQATELRRRLAGVSALKLAGRFRDGLYLAQALAPQAAALGYRPVEAAYLHAIGDLQARNGDVRGGERTLAEAVRTAQAGRDTREAAAAAIDLGLVAGVESDQVERGTEYLQTAAALVESLGPGADATLRAKLEGAEGQLLVDIGKLAEGVQHHLRALELFQQAGNSLDAAISFNELGGAYRKLGRYPEALASHARALAIREPLLGPTHPSVSSSIMNMANVHYSQGRHDLAQPLFERGLAVREKAFGPEHPRTADAHVGLAQNLDSLGRREEALPHLARALAIQEKTIGADHPDVGRTYNALGDVYRSLNRHQESLEAYQRALAIKEKVVGAEHPTVAVSTYSVAEALLTLGKNAEALAMFERTLAIDTHIHGEDSPELAYALTGIGKATMALGRAGDAIAPIQRALSLRDATPGDPSERAESQYFLAQALWESRRDRKRALDLARRARATFAEAGEGQKAELAAVDSWLANHPDRGR